MWDGPHCAAACVGCGPQRVAPGHNMPADSVAILMVDTTAPVLARATQPGAPFLAFQALSAWLNWQYAKRHGYTLLYLLLVEPGCRHPRWGWRHPSYCKLPAIGAAFKRFATVACIDSDAYFHPAAPALNHIVAAHSASAEVTDVSFSSDRPFSDGPNCGFMVWKRSPRTLDLLATWWHLDMGPFAQAHDYEQRAVYWVLAHLDRFHGLLQTLRLRPLDPNASVYVHHIDHTRRGERLWRFAIAALQTKLGDDAERSKFLASVAPILRSTDAAGVERLRRNLMEAALGATLDSLPVLLSRTGKPARRGRRARRASVRSRRFNASRAGKVLLPPPAVGSFMDGRGLALRPCNDGLREWQGWSWATDAERGEGVATTADPARKALSLSACSASSSSLCHCVASGPSSVLREPRIPLAQLRLCNQRIMVGTTSLGIARRLGQAGSLWVLQTARQTGASGRNEMLRDNATTAATASGRTEPAADLIEVSHFLADLANRSSARDDDESTLPQPQEGGPATPGAQITNTPSVYTGAAAGKHGTWRIAHADAARLFQPCLATPSTRADKAVQDCESWCRPERKPAHCHRCKCRACSACKERTQDTLGANTASANNGVLNRQQKVKAASRGRGLWHASKKLCLSVWHQDPLDGSPLTFAPCRYVAKAQQRWSLTPMSISDGGSIDGSFQMRPIADPSLCITAHPLHTTNSI